MDHPAWWYYLLTPLGNQKTLRKTLKALPWKSVPSVSSVDTGHGRRVRRTAKAIEAPAWVDFPGAAQVVQLRRTRTIKSRKHVEVVYLICSLPMTDAQPEVVAAWIQGHWGSDPSASSLPPSNPGRFSAGGCPYVVCQAAAGSFVAGCGS